jgi:hypothetical protein
MGEIKNDSNLENVTYATRKVILQETAGGQNKAHSRSKTLAKMNDNCTATINLPKNQKNSQGAKISIVSHSSLSRHWRISECIISEYFFSRLSKKITKNIIESQNEILNM